MTASDRNGLPVKVGTRVRVLEIASSLKQRLPLDEVRALETMVGEVFEVYEIDQYGAAWVEKWWNEPGRRKPAQVRVIELVRWTVKMFCNRSTAWM